MSMIDRWLMNHCTGTYNVSAREQKKLKERQDIVRDYASGLGLPDILDRYSVQPRYLDDKTNSEFGIMQFEESSNFTWIERPNDKTKLFMDRDTKEVVAINYHKEDFENDMSKYWDI